MLALPRADRAARRGAGRADRRCGRLHRMKSARAAILVLSLAGAAAAEAQTTPMPVPPPVSPALPQIPGSAPSPILTQPRLVHQPFGGTTAPIPPPAA